MGINAVGSGRLMQPTSGIAPEAMCPSSSSHHCNRGGATRSRQHNPKPLPEKSQAVFSSLVTGCIFQNCFTFTKNRKITDMSQTTPSLHVTHGTLGHRQWFLAYVETSSCLSPPSSCSLLSKIPHPRSIHTVTPHCLLVTCSSNLDCFPTFLETWTILRIAPAA